MVEKRSKILIEAQEFAEGILSNQLSDELKYHSINHTYDVVSAALEIARHSNLSTEEQEVVELAAWFHDLGYREVVENHEKVSAAMVLDFLSERKYDDTKAAQVAECIMATQLPQSPKNKMEAIVCDADMLHLGNEDYFNKAKLLRKEIQEVKGKKITPAEWMESNKKFITGHTFFTEYARQVYAGKKDKNLEKLNEELKRIEKDND